MFEPIKQKKRSAHERTQAFFGFQSKKQFFAPAQGNFDATKQHETVPKEDDAIQSKLDNTIQREASSEEETPKKDDNSNITAQTQSDSPTSLSDEVQTKMENSLGTDFSDVNIHTNSIQAKNIGALAYTQGNDIHFAENQYNPNTQSGQTLLGHELTHVVQQRQGRVQPTVQMQGAMINDDPNLEAEADQMGEEAAHQKIKDTKEDNSSKNTAEAIAPLQMASDKGVIQASLLDSVASAAGGVWDATGGRVVDAAGNVIEMGADFFWSLIEKASPTGAKVLRKISEVGIINFLKDELKKVADKIFNRITNNSGLIAQVMPMFRNLLTRAKSIMSALAAGDCKPLFAAMNELKDILSKLAGDTWDKITDFLKPVGAFFEEVWQSFGAPVLDWVQKTAGNLWNQLKNFGANLWKWTQPVRNTLAKAWDWVKGIIGLNEGSGGDGEGGIIQWVQGKLEEAWTHIKDQLKPLVEPMRKVIAKVKAILPIDAILDLREKVSEWLDKAAAAGDAMGADGSGVGNEKQQISLRNEILPAVMKVVKKMQDKLINAGKWVAEKIGDLGDSVDGFFQSLSNIPLVSAAAGALDWLRNIARDMVNWAKDTVNGAAQTISNGMGKIEGFMKKVLTLLEKLGGVLSDLLGKLPDLIMGPAFMVLPECLKEPIKKFILEQILARVPFFQQLMKVGDIWNKLKDMALQMLKNIFVDGDLIGAIWTFYRNMLEILNVPPQLVTNLISKGARAMKDILADPFGFLMNFLRTLKTGFLNFLSNIGTHLLNGIGKWITGQLEGTSVELPKDFSFKEIFKFVASVLGITKDYIVEKIAKHTGKSKEFILKWIERGQKGLEWLQTLLTEGPAAIWQKIQESIDNLWDTILDAVSSWVQGEIVEKAIAWIATKLDPTGIMAVITTIIDVMNLIESLAAQLRQILEIINGVIDGIAEIAKGIIDKGAQFVESSLAGGIPVALNILAGILGLDGIGEKVQEVIKGLREKIDTAIDKVAAGLKKFIKGAIDVGKDVVNMVLDFFGVKTHFTAENGEEHDVYYENASRPVLMVASTPKPIREFIKFYKDQYGLDNSDPILIALNAELKSVDKLINELDNAKETDKPNIQRKLLEANVDVSNLLKKLLKDNKEVGKIIDSYKLEGLTGTYGSMPKASGDALTPDHQPQASALEWAAAQSFFGASSNMKKRAANRAANGFAINLSHIRHVAGRTYGSPPASFVKAVKNALVGKTKAQEKRDVVVDELKNELKADVTAMKNVINTPKNWEDIDNIKDTDLPPAQKTKLKKEIKGRIESGEEQITNQDLDSLRN